MNKNTKENKNINKEENKAIKIKENCADKYIIDIKDINEEFGAIFGE